MINKVTKEFCIKFINNFKDLSIDNTKFIVSDNECDNTKNPSYKIQQIESTTKRCFDFFELETTNEEMSLPERINLLSDFDASLQRFQTRVEQSIKNRWWYSWVNPLGYQAKCPKIEHLRLSAQCIKGNLQRKFDWSEEKKASQESLEKSRREHEEQIKLYDETSKKRKEEMAKFEEESRIIEEDAKEWKRLLFLSANDQHLVENVPCMTSPSKDLILCYEILSKILLEEKLTLCIQDKTTTHHEMLLGVIGKGGWKQAILLEQGRALLLPNMTSNPPEKYAADWERTVNEEVSMSTYLNSLGLLCLNSKRVDIQFPNLNMKETIPAYLSDTFESMSQNQGLFIIDVKNWSNSTWIQGKHFLFENNEDRLVENNWAPFVDALLTDIAKICAFKIPIGGDSQTIAILQKENTGSYEIRSFCFDFSSKDTPLSFLKTRNNVNIEPKFHSQELLQSWKALVQKENKDRAEELFSSFLDILFFCEFHPQYDNYGSDERGILREFKQRLVDEYINEILIRIEKYKAI